MPPFRIEPLRPNHERASFTGGVAPLDHYLQRQATQDMRRRVTACYVALDSINGRIAGYYTLAAGAVSLADLPESLAKRLPRCPSVPVVRLGRLAIDLSYRGRKLGSALLWDAGLRSLRSEIAAFALLVDAKDAPAESFYRHHGFIPLGNQPMHLVLPLATFAKA
jgi:GNAT superfamily N-acetyltransferase